MHTIVICTLEHMVVEFVRGPPMSASSDVIVHPIPTIVRFSDVCLQIAKVAYQEIQNIQTIAVRETFRFPLETICHGHLVANLHIKFT